LSEMHLVVVPSTRVARQDDINNSCIQVFCQD
jgi:hypothetical protein